MSWVLQRGSAPLTCHLNWMGQGGPSLPQQRSPPPPQTAQKGRTMDHKGLEGREPLGECGAMREMRGGLLRGAEDVHRSVSSLGQQDWQPLKSGLHPKRETDREGKRAVCLRLGVRGGRRHYTRNLT